MYTEYFVVVYSTMVITTFTILRTQGDFPIFNNELWTLYGKGSQGY